MQENQNQVRNIKSIRVYSREVKYEGKKFYTLSTKKKNGESIQVKFTKEVDRYINTAGFYLVYVDTLTCSIQQQKEPKKDILWVKYVEKINRDVDYEEKIKQENQSAVNELFGQDVVVKE